MPWALALRSKFAYRTQQMKCVSFSRVPLSLLAAIFLLSGAACDAQRAKAPELYEKLCAECHGANLEGAIAPALLNNEWKYGKSDEEVYHSIAVGYPDSNMPGYADQLSEEEIRGLVIYLREARARETRQSRPRPELEDGADFDSQHERFRARVLRDDLNVPWSITFLPDGDLLVTERDEGTLLRFSADGSDRSVIEGTPEINNRGQAGLLDVALDPEYAENGWVYLSFVDPLPEDDERAITSVVRGRIREGRWADEEVIWRVPDEFYVPGAVHFGSRFTFDPEGRLYFTLGDRGRGQTAQNLSDPRGAVHRINRDGSIPEDNPFLDRGDAFKSLYSYGHRNPQGLDRHPGTDEIWLNEHGPRGGDELNLINKGANYGWPEVTFGMNYNGTPITAKTTGPGITDPVMHWTPSIAACGMSFLSGNKFPGWENDLFLTSLKFGQLHRLRIGPDNEVVEEEVVLNNLKRARHVAAHPDGTLYLLLERPGRIVRLEPVD